MPEALLVDSEALEALLVEAGISRDAFVRLLSGAFPDEGESGAGEAGTTGIRRARRCRDTG